MKTTAVAVTALLASIAFAQPYHGRHLHKKDLHKRKLVVVTTTCTEYATLIIDQDGTSLIEPTPTPAQFYPSTTSEETTSTTSSTTSTSTSTSQPTTSSTSTTSTSTYVQQQLTTSTPQAQVQEITPTTTTEAPAYTQTTSEAAAPTSGSGSSGGGSSYSGDITYYELGLTACGQDLSGVHSDGSSPSAPAAVAVAFDRFTAANPNDDPLCGKVIKITGNGQTGYGMIHDKCRACAYNDLDLNIEGFEHFYASSQGRGSITWEFV